MSRGSRVRRAIAEIRWDNDPSAVAWVGSRSVQSYWTLLSAYFRDVLLPPQRRAEENGVTWSWREPDEAAPVSASELRTLRKRLADEQQLFADNLARGLNQPGEAGGLKGQQNVDQLGTVMAAVVAGLIARSDEELSGFVCRTETGLRLHSWGAAIPARATYPDTQGLELAGRVLVGGKPARHDVVLESSDGETIAETPSDTGGEFRFSKLSPGEYRLRARTMRGTFPPHGLAVSLQGRSVTDLVLADARSDAPSPLIAARRAAGKRPLRTPVLLALLVLLGGGGFAAWKWSQPPEDARVIAQTKTESASSNGTAPGATAKSASAKPQGASVASKSEAGAPKVSSANAGGTSPAITPPGSTSSRGPKDLALPVDGRVVQQTATLPPRPTGLPAATPGQPPPNSGTPGALAGAPTAPAGNPVAPASGAAAGPTQANVTPNAMAASATAGTTPPLPDATVSAIIPAVTASDPTTPAPTPPPVAPEKPSADVAASLPKTPENKTEDAVRETASARSNREKETVVNQTTETGPAESPAARPTTMPTPATGPVAGRNEESTNVSSDTTRDTHTPNRVSVPTSATSGATAEAATADAGQDVPRKPRAPLPPLGPLTRTVRVRVAPWRTKVLSDSILPTQPVPIKEAESVATLRARMLADQDARLPAVLRDPVATFAIVLEFPAAIAPATLLWRDDQEILSEQVEIRENRALVEWDAKGLLRDRVRRLQRHDGAILAEVRLDASGRELVVRTNEDTRAWMRVAIEIGREDGRRAMNWTFHWRTAAGAPLPPNLNGEMLGGEQTALRIPLGHAPGAVSVQGFALMESSTGWALVTDIRQAADRPLGE